MGEGKVPALGEDGGEKTFGDVGKESLVRGW